MKKYVKELMVLIVQIAICSSPPNTLTKLQSMSIHDKELWLNEVSRARKKYVELDDEVTCQVTSQQN